MNTTRDRSHPIEWPTIALIALMYVVVSTLVWFHQSLPWWSLLPVGAYFVALQASLQHEVLHGHPTRNGLVNELLIFPTLHFWLPYRRYKTTHLIHHNDADLTDPRFDPESQYLLPEVWATMPGLKRTLLRMNHTLAGRMIMGPAISLVRFWWGDFRDMARGDARKVKEWLLFALSASVTISYVCFVVGMPFWKYILLFAYPGISLALVRSYCEHQASDHLGERTIIVEASPFWSLLFLFNNLHVAHHTRPALAWYLIPDYYRNEKAKLLAANHGYTMKGYGEIFRRYFFRAKEPIPYPDMTWLRRG